MLGRVEGHGERPLVIFEALDYRIQTVSGKERFAGETGARRLPGPGRLDHRDGGVVNSMVFMAVSWRLRLRRMPMWKSTTPSALWSIQNEPKKKKKKGYKVHTCQGLSRRS